MNRSKKSRSSKKKRRSKSKSKSAIKKPLTNFMLFAQDEREENEKEGGDPLTLKEIGKRWKKLSKSKKKMYQDIYEKNRLEYEEKITKSKKNDDDDDDSDNKKKTKSKSKSNKNSKKKCDCGKCAFCKENLKKNNLDDDDEEEDD